MGSQWRQTMYLSYFTLNERPFSISPDPRFLFMSHRYREALAHLTYGIKDAGGFVLLTGEVGTGKTTVCRCLLQQLPKNTRLAFVLNPKLDSVELLATICDELKVDYPENCQSLKILTDKLSVYFVDCYEKGLNVVVMIDEAQNIASDVLEQIRLLTNLETNQKKLLQIILVGQPELQEKLARRDLRQLAQRITARYHLRPLSLKETMAYVLHRTKIAGSRKSLFTARAVEHLYLKTKGIPRLINTICDRALLAAANRKKTIVDVSIMKNAIREVMGTWLVANNYEEPTGTNWKKIGLMATLGLLVIGIAYWSGKQANSGRNIETKISNSDSKSQMKKTIANEPDRSSETVQANENRVMLDQNNRKAPVRPVAMKSIVELQAELLQRILKNEIRDTDGSRSMRQLLKEWQVDFDPSRNGRSCKFALDYGLLCHLNQGNWSNLRAYNRPAILKFSAGMQGDFWGTLIGLNDNKATLVFGGHQSQISLKELSTLWTGEFRLVWQAPKGYLDDIRIGDKGEPVIWLATRLKSLVNDQLKIGPVFTRNLKLALSNYQTQRNIKRDGIAGMQTIMLINAETYQGIPLLHD